jgi:hypothetical protein
MVAAGAWRVDSYVFQNVTLPLVRRAHLTDRSRIAPKKHRQITASSFG